MPSKGSARRPLGLDLDNTVIDYANAYSALATEFDLPQGCDTREGIRGMLRRSPDDDDEWQRFQALLYTDGLEYARPAEGLLPLLEACHEGGLPVLIVSHKTPTGPQRFGSRDLRTPARRWLLQHGITPRLVADENVTFHATALDKVAWIARVLPAIFVDDLEEILSMEGFPDEVQRVLFTAGSDWVDRRDGTAVAGFSALAQKVLE